MTRIRSTWKCLGGVTQLPLVLVLLVVNVAARELQQPGLFSENIERNTLQLEFGKRSAPRGTERHQMKPMADTFSTIREDLATGAGALHAHIMHRDAPSSPFRLSNRTRVERMHVTISRDNLRVASIHGRINQTVNGLTRSRSRDRQTKVPSQDFQAPVVSGLSLGSGEYFIRISVGTPPRRMYLVMDTGSDILWLQCAPCVNCYHQSDAIFDPYKSSTYSTLGCSTRQCLNLDIGTCQANKCLYQVDYGDGSFTTGEFGTDDVSLNSTSGVGQVVLNKIPLGCGHDNEGYFVGAAGLLGLGKGPLSFPNQVDPQNGGRFSYCLTDRETDSTEGSSLVFGEAAVPPAGARFTPQDSNMRVPTFYYLKMTGISVGGTILTIPTSAFQLDSLGNGGVIIDSGTSVTRLQNAAYASLRDAFRAGTSDLAPTAGFSLFDTCYDLSGLASVDVPTVTLHFQGGTDLKLPASNYLIPVDNSNTFCLAFAGTTGPSIIGNIQQQGFRVIYDNLHNQVGFVPSQCN
ncbi:aspartyl protease family protein 2 [Physcomitrium patens]|uniref:Peptidase A1 domain-containing protein n=1 Tax=Physcomitrium patens TaxID=3218 RepID=A0A2K1J2W8_PHYPA|nr:aspartyl protease family protein 2-like [Physcomitrium patens]XP_024399857.1 aspartyl protease family protein 2-like [Physcomitrium patens]XP_024399858.1 aspartyl protease family protein 2-like [Physcomitrium patens]XP_024399859.1 aspartyl protease family protein 2-like [Physcomitrium patens]XP_024399860.1 aspartyl protease family protein 2-like [Physcomitrium patens]XP_024399861.1 aspartyl protease family protein 2-like [Physcomitrium patens]XP_024399862.1 aspartyl protease family protein|eukprot:XP_024399856.1 aspartyl protease family protein 2-like [Physcomitrella patens]